MSSIYIWGRTNTLAWKKRSEPDSLHKVWAVFVEVGLWLRMNDLGAQLSSENGPAVCAQAVLTGFALFTALDALKKAGKLTPDSTFKDLAFVVSAYIFWMHNIPQYGIEDEAVS
ncbi:hypothetical protein B0J11DRAFT_571368 [Dendryphion nanum]|uniref:Uncharacterized protein n=1 Tax=Dendryphion nanum TaxID=256645 RepID=A0A9P9DCM0_9PLEO|nr:hypothetical protein B0J11DRAFT_571368 [Dendryphion nanum]